MDQTFPVKTIRFSDLIPIASGSLSVQDIFPIINFDTASGQYFDRTSTVADLVSYTSEAVGIGSFVLTASFGEYTSSYSNSVANSIQGINANFGNYALLTQLESAEGQLSSEIASSSNAVVDFVTSSYTSLYKYNIDSSSFSNSIANLTNLTSSYVTNSETSSFVNSSSFGIYTSSVSSSFLSKVEFHTFTTSLLTIANTASYIFIDTFNTYTASVQSQVNALTSSATLSFSQITQSYNTLSSSLSQLSSSFLNLVTSESISLSSSIALLSGSYLSFSSSVSESIVDLYNYVSYSYSHISPAPSSSVLLSEFLAYTQSVYQANTSSVPWVATLLTAFSQSQAINTGSFVNTSSYNAYQHSQDQAITSSYLNLSSSISNLQNEINQLAEFSSSVTFTTASLVSSASFNAYTSSIAVQLTAYTTTQSFTFFTASINLFTSSITFQTASYLKTSSFNQYTSSIVTTSSFLNLSSSISTNLNGLNTFSASLISSSFIGSLTFNSYTSSLYNVFESQISYSLDSASYVRSLNSLNLFTSSLVFPNVGSYVVTSSFYQFTSSTNQAIQSLNAFTASVTFPSTASFVNTSSFGLFTSSVNTFISSTNLWTSSIDLWTSSINTFSSSVLQSISSLNNFTASVIFPSTTSFVNTSSFNSFTTSYNSSSQSFASSLTALNNFSSSVVFPNNSFTSSYLTTASFNSLTSSFVVNTSSLLSISNYQIDSASFLSSEYYSNSTPTPSTLGGISAGSTFVSQSMQQMFNALLYPYQSPAFSSFAISGQTTPIEVGSSISSGLKTFTFGTTNSTNVKLNSIIIKDITGGTTLGSGLPNVSPFTSSYVNAISQSSRNATYQWSIGGVNTNNVSMSNNNYSVTWQSQKYVGYIPNSSLSALQAVSSSTQLASVPGIVFTSNGLDGNSRTTGTTSFNFGSESPPGGLAFWLYADVMGTTTFTQGGFSYPVGLTITNGWINTYGINIGNYYLYISTNPTQGSFTVVAA